MNEYLKYIEFFVKNVSCDLRRNKINWGTPASLEHIAITQTAIFLWKYHICNEIEQIFCTAHSLERVTQKLKLVDIFEENIQKKITNLRLTLHCERTLKQIVHKIGKTFFRFIYALHNESNCIYCQFYTLGNFKVYLQHICWTQQGTINKFEMVKRFVNNNHLDLRIRYIFACNFCMEDKIRELHEKLPENFINNYFEDDDEANNDDPFKVYKRFRLVLFWTFYVNGEPDRFSKFTAGQPTYKYLLDWAIMNKHEAAVQYIWENFADEHLKQDIVHYAESSSEESETYNIAFFLLTQMNRDQILEARMQIGYKLLEVLLHYSELQKPIVPSMEVMEGLILTYNSENELHLYISLAHANLMLSDIYKEILNEYVFRHKKYIKANLNKIFSSLIHEILVKKNDKIARNALLSVCNSQQRKTLLYEAGTMHACYHLICDGKLDVLDKFVNEMVGKGGGQKFKIRLLNEENSDICVNFIERGKYEQLDRTLVNIWSKEDLIKFKKGLPYKGEGKIILILLNLEDDLMLPVLDQFLSWCLDYNEEEIKKAKSFTFNLDSDLYTEPKDVFFDYIESLIRRGKWRLIEECWKWIFLAVEEEKINSCSKKLERINKIINMSGEKHESSVKSFITFCFKQDEMDDLKKGLEFLHEGLENGEELISILNTVIREIEPSNIDSDVQIDKLN